MQRTILAAFAGGALLTTALSAAAEPSAQEIEWCANKDHAFSADQQIKGCTAAIESGAWTGKNLAWAFNDRGFGYLLKGDLDQALADFSEAIRLDPNDAVAFDNRGNIYRMKGDPDRAIAEYDEAIRLDPTYALTFENRGSALRDMGKPDRAIADFTEAIRLEPTFTVALNQRGDTYLAKNQIDNAIADFSQAIQLDPKYARAFNNRCFAHELKGDIERALSDCDQAIRLDAENAGAFNNRGNAYQAKGDFARAITDFTAAIRLDPQDSKPYYNRGIAYFYSGSLGQAAADFERSSQRNPANPYTALWLDITDDRANLPSHFGQAASQLNMGNWPAPIVRLYLGQVTADEAFAAANDADAATRQRHVCEASFFIGELALRRHLKDKAAGLFRQVMADCEKNPVLSAFADAELKGLGTQP